MSGCGQTKGGAGDQKARTKWLEKQNTSLHVFRCAQPYMRATKNPHIRARNNTATPDSQYLRAYKRVDDLRPSRCPLTLRRCSRRRHRASARSTQPSVFSTVAGRAHSLECSTACKHSLCILPPHRRTRRPRRPHHSQTYARTHSRTRTHNAAMHACLRSHRSQRAARLGSAD